MTTNIKRDFRYAANGLAVISALATVACYLTGFSGFEAWLFAALGFICCIMQPRIWAHVLNNRHALPIPALVVGLSAGVLCSWTDLTSNFQTISAARGLDVQRGEVQTANYQSQRKSLDQSNALLASAEDRLSKLNSSYDWLPVATAAGIAAEIENAEGDYIFKRSRSCADVTLRSSRVFCDKLTVLRNKQGVIQARDDLKVEIASLKNAADEARHVATNTKPGESRAYAQAVSMTSLLTWNGDEASDVAKANLHNLINLGLAFALWFLPTAFMVFGYETTPEPRSPVQSRSASPNGPHVEARSTPSRDSGPPRDPPPGREIDNKPVEIPIDITPRVRGQRIEYDANAEAEAVVRDLRPRLQERRAEAYPSPPRRIVRVRDTRFARRVATLTADYQRASNVRSVRTVAG